MNKLNYVLMAVISVCVPLSCMAASAVMQRIAVQAWQPFVAGLATGAATHQLRSNHVKKIIAASDVAATTYLTINHYKKNPLPGSQECAELMKLELIEYSGFINGVRSDGYQVNKGDEILKQFPNQGSSAAFEDAQKFLQAQQKPLVDKINAVGPDNRNDMLSTVAIKGGAFAAGAALGYNIMSYLHRRDNKTQSDGASQSK
jgi:hypothetical protein